MDVASLLVKVGFRTDSKPLENLQAKLEGINSKLRILAGAEVIRALYHMTEGFGHSALELENTAAAAGITTDALQKLQFAVAQSGGNANELGMTMTHLARMIQQAKLGGDEAIATFYQLGISQQQIASFTSTEDALYGVMDALQRIQDPIKQHAMLDRALGQGARGLAAFALGGTRAAKASEAMAVRIRAIVPKDTVYQLARAKGSLDGLGLMFKAVGSTLGGMFAPVVVRVVGEIERFYEVNQKLINNTLEQWAEKAAYGLGFVVGLFRDVGGAIVAFIGRHKELITTTLKLVAAWSLFTGGVTALAEAASTLRTAWAGVAGIFAAAPYVGMALAIGLAVSAVHDLWAMMSGGKIEDLWLYKTFQMIGDFTSKGAIGDMIQGGIGGVSGGLGNSQLARTLLPGLFPEVAGTMPNALSNMAAMRGNAPPPSIAAPSSMTTSNQGIVNMAVTNNISVPPGLSVEDTKKALADSVREHRTADFAQAMKRWHDPLAY